MLCTSHCAGRYFQEGIFTLKNKTCFVSLDWSVLNLYANKDVVMIGAWVYYFMRVCLQGMIVHKILNKHVHSDHSNGLVHL